MELTLDTEQTTRDKGDPFQRLNTLTCVSVTWNNDGAECLPVVHDEAVGAVRTAKRLHDLLNQARCVTGHNLKRDLHWLRRYDFWSPRSYPTLTYYDTQIAEFLLTGQTTTYAALEDLAVKYEIEHSKGSLQTYWSAGIDTDQIGWETLSAYAIMDCKVTQAVRRVQQPLLEERGLTALFELEMVDMLTLNEMEWNGVMFNLDGMKEDAVSLKEELDGFDKVLSEIVACPVVNWNSNDHVSAVLFGGSIKHSYRVDAGVFKSGLKAGQPKTKVVTDTITFPRLAEPIKETKKEGVFSTNESDLKLVHRKTKNPTVKAILDKLSERAYLEKLLGTYLVGIPEKASDRGWTDNIVHGKYNQCVARTGRLSSSDPNMQNLDKRVQKYIVSRYAA